MTIVADKMFLVLDSIANDDQDAVGLARLTKETNVPKATLYRLLCDLVGAGVVDHGPGGYSLGARLFELGNAVPRYRQLRMAAVPHLEALHQQTSETVHMAAVQNEHLVLVEKLHASHRVRIPTRVGMQLPLHSTALGKVALANLPRPVLHRAISTNLRPVTQRTLCAPGLLQRQIDQCSSDGFAVECEETFAGVGCLAAPVLTADGALAGILSVSGDPRTRRAASLIKRLHNAADAISRDLASRLTA